MCECKSFCVCIYLGTRGFFACVCILVRVEFLRVYVFGYVCGSFYWSQLNVYLSKCECKGFCVWMYLGMCGGFACVFCIWVRVCQFYWSPQNVYLRICGCKRFCVCVYLCLCGVLACAFILVRVEFLRVYVFVHVWSFGVCLFVYVSLCKSWRVRPFYVSQLIVYLHMCKCRCGCLGARERQQGGHIYRDRGWRRLVGSPKLRIIFHKRATKYRSLLRKMTYKDKGSYESSPPCRGR